MVIKRNVGQYEGVPPNEGEGRAIRTERGLYASASIEEILAKDGERRIHPVTRLAKHEMQRLGWDLSDLSDVVREALKDGEYIGSEWCLFNDAGTGAACDAYRYRRRERVQAGIEMTCEYYLKWAIGQCGDSLLVVSCHLPKGEVG